MRALGALAALCLLLVAWPAAATTIDKDFHETFDVEEGATLHLASGDGDVTLEPWDRDVVDVKVRYHAEFKGVWIAGDPDFDVEFRQEGPSIRVRGIESSGNFGFFYTHGRTYEYEYTISAPPYVRLTIEGDDGDVRVEGWEADISCTVDDGDVLLSDVSADRVRVDMEDGDLVVQGLSGELSVSADDGDLYLSDCTMPSCRLRFNDGDVDISRCSGTFDMRADDGDIRMDTTSASALEIRGEDGDIDAELMAVEAIDVDVAVDDGRVVLSFEKGTSASFTLDSDDGRIEVRVPGAVRLEQGRNWATGEMGDGEGRIRIRTADGSILFEER